jgi:hypothetical protein
MKSVNVSAVWHLGAGAVPVAALIAASCASSLGSPPDTTGVDAGTPASEDGGSPSPSQDSGRAGVMDSGSPPSSRDSGVVDTGAPSYPTYDADLPDTALPCVVGGAGPASLPFRVDQYFVTSGWMQAQYIHVGSACSRPSGESVDAGDAGDDASVSDGGEDGSVSDAGAAKCWTWTYAPGGVSTWAGVDWQYPAGNWGTTAGLAIPAGATAVTFYAWGATGTETVSFNVGYGLSSPDGFGASLPNQHLTTMPTQYSISLPGDNYVCHSTRMGFGWTTGGAISETFFIDSITWQ